MEVKMRKFLKTMSLATIVTMVVGVQLFAQSIESGLKDLEAERYTAANTTFTQLVSSSPTAENLFYQGYTLLRSPEANKADIQSAAMVLFEKGNAIEKKGDPLNTVGMGMVKYAQKDFAGAKVMFEEAIKRSRGKDADVINRIGEAHIIFSFVNDPAEAIKYADQAIEVSKTKDNPDYYLTKANAYYIMNEGGDAMNALQNAERLTKDKAMVLAKMGQIWLQGRNYEDAKKRLDEAVAADPTHAPAYKYLSSFYQIYQKFDKSAEMADLYLQNSDGDCGAKLRYAQLAFIGKAYDKVLKTVDEIKSCNDDPIVYRLSGISQFYKGNYNESIELMETYISKADKEKVYGLDYGFEGRDYLALGNTDKAMEYIEKAYAMKDTTYDYYTEFAEYFKEKRDYDKSADMYQKVIETKGKKADGGDYANVGITYFSSKNYKKADVAFDKVVVLYKDSWPAAYYYSALAKQYKSLPEPDSTFAGAERYERYLSLLDEDNKVASAAQVASAYNYLAGKAFNIDNDTQKAMDHVEKALKYDPSNARALDLKNTLTPSEGSAIDSTGIIPTQKGSSGN
jgi:tetratricopeptide (TPR) repeat protein